MMKHRFVEKIIFIVISSAVLTGCAKKDNYCGDPDTLNQIQTMILKDLKESSKLTIRIISTQKNDADAGKENDEKSCKGTAEIGIREEVVKKFTEYNNLLGTELGVKFQNSNTNPYQFGFQFQLIKNEMNQGNAISAKWENLDDKINFIPIQEFDKIDQNINKIPLAKINREFEKWLQSDQRTANEVKKYVESKDRIIFKGCNKIMDMEKQTPQLNVFCDYENEAGGVTTVTVFQKPAVKILKNMSEDSSPIVGMYAAESISNLPMRMTKITGEELKNYLESNSRVDYSEHKSDLY